MSYKSAIASAETAAYKTVFDKVLSDVNPEKAHNYVLTALEGVQNYDRMMADYDYFADQHGFTTDDYTPNMNLIEDVHRYDDDRLEQEVFGLQFDNPVGIAAGFDKDARVPDMLAALGFGYVEVGGVTSHPQDGNPAPRLHRVEEENALINRLGFNNDGAPAVRQNLARSDLEKPTGINLGESHRIPYADSAAETLQYTQEHGDYAVANVSCPNVDNDAELQDATELDHILSTLNDANTADIPLLIKISPDLETNELDALLDVAQTYDVDGIVATNTSIRHDLLPGDEDAYPEGGLSGDPINDLSTAAVAAVYEHVGDDIPIIGVGGVRTAEDAYEKIQAGASLVQLYTGMVYEGPAIARNINEELAELLEEDGQDHISDAVGAAHS